MKANLIEMLKAQGFSDLRCMAHARRDGGLYCDGVVSKEA